MSLNSFIKIFLPKDRIFYHLFEQVADNLVLIGETLRETVITSAPEKRTELIRKIEDLEHVNDDFTHKIFVELGQNFITPFDREDIHYLASALDDVADYIHGSSKRLAMYRIYQPNESIMKLSDLIYQAVVELKKAIYELRNLKNLRIITDACVRINSLENHADDIYDAAVAKLFDYEKDPLVVMKMREIFQSLETATDKCEDAANVMESIIVKYA
jgi:predicted phosphate transport protein (TIGR00153 family)